MTQNPPISDLMPGEARGHAPSRASLYRKVLLAMVTGGIFVLIFAKIIPELGSYNDIWDQIKATPVWQLVALLAIAVVIMALSTAMMVLPVRGIGPWRAFFTQQASTAISFTIPGPSGTGARFVMLRSYGVDVEDFSRGTVAVSVWNNLTMLSMPGVAVLLFVVFGQDTGSSDTLAAWGLLAIAVTVALIGLLSGVLRSVHFARGLGRVSMAATNLVLRLFRRPLVDGWPEAAVTLRANTVTVLKARGGRLTWLTLSNYWINGILLVLCLRLVGVDSSVLPWGVALATYTVGRLSTVIQVTPGGVGVVEAAYTAAFVAVTSPSLQPTILAGVLIYRAYTYVLPIIVGAFCYLAWRRDKGRQPLNEAVTTAG